MVSLPVERIFRRLGLPIERLGHRQAVDLGAVRGSGSASIWMSGSPVPSASPCRVPMTKRANWSPNKDDAKKSRGKTRIKSSRYGPFPPHAKTDAKEYLLNTF